MSGSSLFGKSICSVATNITEQDKSQIQAVGISGIICMFALLIPILVLEAHYIFGYRSNFLIRLFFYMTLSACMLDAVYAIYIINSGDFYYRWVCSLTDYAIYVQVILVMIINLVLLGIMHQFIRGKKWYSENSIFCAYPKINEIIFVISLVLCPIIVPAIELLATDKNWSTIKRVIDDVFYTLLAIDWLLSIVCILVLVYWFHMMLKNRLLRNKIGIICREMSLFLWFMVFVLLWGVATILETFDSSSAWYAIFPIVQTITPVSFFFYIWLTYLNNKRKANAQINNLTTNPDSLPRKVIHSETDQNAIPFLSPSTASPTEQTHLLHTA